MSSLVPTYAVPVDDPVDVAGPSWPDLALANSRNRSIYLILLDTVISVSLVDLQRIYLYFYQFP